VGVDDLAEHSRASTNMTCDASILQVGTPIGKVLLAISVAADAEVGLLDGAEPEAVVVVVTRGAQTAAQLAGRRITDEPPCVSIRSSESISAKRPPCGDLVVQRALKSSGKVLADKCLLELGLVAAPAFAVSDRLREVGMAPRRVALSAMNAHRRVTTFGVVRDGLPRMAGHAVFDVGGRPEH